MTRLPLTLTLLLPIIAACELKGVSLTGANIDEEMTTSGSGDPTGATGDSGTGGDPTGDDPTGGTTGEPPAPVTAVDILFVIDNSGSMAGHQSRLAASIPALLSGLDGLDLRIAVTTTDNGNPRCPAAQTTPEGGEFVMRHCIDAVEDGEWMFDSKDYSAACLDHCQLQPGDGKVVTKPTATALDPEPKLRHWIERTGDELNSFADLELTLACALPQGVAGCGFESPLESMYKALARAADPSSETNYGFLRPEADLRIIFVTDEADCSHKPEFDEIFTVNKTFWEDPNRPDSTSAVCFNAGVTCSGGPGTYDSCTSANYDITGALTMDPNQAVLQPLSKYVQFLQDIQASKVGAADVRIFALAGVPVGFETGSVPLVYADDPDQSQHDLFGIGPGCTAEDPENPNKPVAAIPPTRLLSVAQALGDPQVFSICDDNFDAALMAAGFAP